MSSGGDRYPILTFLCRASQNIDVRVEPCCSAQRLTSDGLIHVEHHIIAYDCLPKLSNPLAAPFHPADPLACLAEVSYTQLAVPLLLERVRAFLSDLDQYSERNALAVLFQVQQESSNALEQERFRKCGLRRRE